MATFTLDAIREAADAKYGSTDIELGNGDVLRLMNPLRLSKDRRDRLTAMQEVMENDDADQVETMRDSIRIVANDSGLAERFLAEVGDDLAVLATVFSMYAGEAQVGEASASQG